jgi:hypothetical protein
LKNHQNIGPVIVQFDIKAVRRLRETSSGNHENDVKNLIKMIASGEYDEQGRKLREKENKSERALQVENPDVVLTQTIVFKNCLFEVRFDCS